MTSPEQMDGGEAPAVRLNRREYEELKLSIVERIEGARQQGYLKGLEDAVQKADEVAEHAREHPRNDTELGALRARDAIRALKPNEGKG